MLTRRRCIRTLGTSAIAAGVGALPRTGLAGDERGRVYADYLSAGDGRPRPASLIEIQGEKIVSVSSTERRDVPRGQRRLWATPGFVAAPSNLGLVEVSLEKSTLDEAPTEDPLAASDIRADFRAADGFNPASSLMPVARLGGITSVVAAPSGGVLSGVSAFADLVDQDLGHGIVTEQVALHIDLDASGERGGRPAVFARLRQAFEAARVFKGAGRRYDAAKTRPLSFSVAALRNLARALNKELPVVVKVSRASDIRVTLRFAKRYGLRLILQGAEEAWTLAPELASLQVPVIVRPLQNLPVQFAALRSRFDNAAILERAGVAVAFMTSGAHDVANLRQEAGNAVAHGMSWQGALSALTSVPAQLFGVKDRGTLAAGKVANVVLWDGDPFELTSSPVALVIRGRSIPLVSRQTALFERYR